MIGLGDDSIALPIVRTEPALVGPAEMPRRRILVAALLMLAVLAGGSLAASTWHSARTLNVICSRGLR